MATEIRALLDECAAKLARACGAPRREAPQAVRDGPEEGQEDDQPEPGRVGAVAEGRADGGCDGHACLLSP